MNIPMYMQQLQSLQNQIATLQRAMAVPNQQVHMPTQQQTPSPMDNQQQMLLKMYDEFANTDDGKALAAGLTKFSRFVQSKVSKE